MKSKQLLSDCLMIAPDYGKNITEMGASKDKNERGRSIIMLNEVWDALDSDAQRCRRSSAKQIEAILISLYSLGDPELLDIDALRRKAALANAAREETDARLNELRRSLFSVPLTERRPMLDLAVRFFELYDRWSKIEDLEEKELMLATFEKIKAGDAKPSPLLTAPLEKTRKRV